MANNITRNFQSGRVMGSAERRAQIIIDEDLLNEVKRTRIPCFVSTSSNLWHIRAAGTMSALGTFSSEEQIKEFIINNSLELPDEEKEKINLE